MSLANPRGGVEDIAVLVYLEIKFRLIVLLRVGIDGAERLLGLYLVALLHIQFAQVGIDGAVVTMLHDNGVGVAHEEATRYLPFVYRARLHARSGLDIDTFVVGYHMLIDGVLLLTELAADIAFLHWPWQFAFVLLESSCYELLLFGERGLGGSLLADGVVYLLIEFRGFLLLFLELGGEVFLFLLEVVEHVLMLLLIACKALLLPLARL